MNIAKLRAETLEHRLDTLQTRLETAELRMELQRIALAASNTELLNLQGACVRAYEHMCVCVCRRTQ